jgi:hypothetical protein
MPVPLTKCKQCYRKVGTQHDEISLLLTYSTYHNPAEKKKTMSINHTAIISINCTTIRKSCQRKRSLYIMSKNRDNLMIKLHYKEYCSILKRVIREAKKVYFKQVIETSEKRQKQCGILSIR